ncbi:MAG TPA: 3-deoxy-7-phosphoheptulonate synthase [Gemmatimonadales bacterium]|nr:3-deoxy-7-phosphoheptulonate synthase [Gemmatimonadales bacterium]
MLILLRSDASAADRARLTSLLESLGLPFQVIESASRSAIALLGGDGRVDPARFAALSGVDEIIPLTRPYRMVAREWRPEPTVVSLPGGVSVGGKEIVVFAGPCAVESEEQIRATARAVKAAGAVALRAGAFKPRTSPYAFQGLGPAGLELLREVREETGLLLVTEALDEAGLEQVEQVADIIQIGARNMQNYALLKRAGRAGKPVLLKRGMTATLTDFLLSAEYVLSEGNANVILCERGIRGLDGSSRTFFDVNAIATVKSLSHLPILADPSHGTGKRALVPAAARAGIAAGADGLLIEVHVSPEEALSDGAQSLYPEQFGLLMEEVRGIAAAIGRKVAR